ncbi:MAG: WD40 repeat domain-containing protein [Planctomycetia bacterium]|nr:WD40 repeat domain-containing protein [Planctomycetia bacterium]
MIPLQTASPHPVTHLLFSPDGATIAVAQPHSGVTLIERSTGHTLAVCAMPRRAILTGLTFCEDGRFLAAASAKGVEVFDTQTGKRVAASFDWRDKSLSLVVRHEGVMGVNVTGDRRVCDPRTISAGMFPAKVGSNRVGFWVNSISPDGRLAIGHRSMIWLALFDLEAWRVVAHLNQPDYERSMFKGTARFCPLGRRFALNDGQTISVYDTGGVVEEDEEDQQTDTPLVQRANGIAVAPKPHVKLSPMFTLAPEKPTVRGWYPPFALAADGRGVLVKRPGNRVQLWDAPTGTLVNQWSWRFEWVTCLALSLDGLTAVVGGRFGRVLIWDLD